MSSSSPFRAAARVASRSCRTEPPSIARLAMRQSRLFFSAARPKPQSEQSWRRSSWVAENLLFGVGLGIGWTSIDILLRNKVAVKAEAIDTGDVEDSSPSAKLKPKTSTPKAKSKTQEKEESKSEPSSSTDAPTASEPDAEVATSNGESNGGAFNPETGEINWDCPCLGGMAHGPCGEEFRAAFSCFVYSEAEPKGIECVEKFKGMQDCFRAHPEVYGEEIMADDEEDGPAPSPSGTDSPSLETSEISPLPDSADSPTPAPVPSESVPPTSSPVPR